MYFVDENFLSDILRVNREEEGDKIVYGPHVSTIKNEVEEQLEGSH